MEDVLDKLKLAGHKLYVATSKPKVYADRILERFNLKKYFEYVAGADLEGHKSSKSDVVKEAMEISHASSDEILMIGDRKHDIIGARDNGTGTGTGRNLKRNVRIIYLIKLRIYYNSDSERGEFE